MLKEVIGFLRPETEGVFIDATVGAGGHAEAILAAGGPETRLIGLDQDPDALAIAGRRLEPWGGRVKLVHTNFRFIGQVLADLGEGPVQGVLLDLGVSSMHFDRPERGFSYHHDGPLDMRMNPAETLTAADIVNEWSHGEITRILREYGQERWASRIAGFIVERREKDPITTTARLVDIIKAAIPAAARRRGGHPARRTFQALRIAVNDELGSLTETLEDAVQCLAPGGRIAVISFHSLEDRIVKHEFLRLSRGCTCIPGVQCTCRGEELLEVLTRRPVRPGPEEVDENPRARSALLRAALRRSARS